MKTVRIVIVGDVQGVNFRSFVKKNADKLRLTGWVKNTNLGLEAMFQGEDKNVDMMLRLCWEGPLLSEVKDIKTFEKIYDASLGSFQIK